MNRRSAVRLLFASVVAAHCAGCLQLETRITLHEDGSATITERLRFSRRLLDLEGQQASELQRLLSREAALDRMKHMGKGVELASHEVRDAEGGSREAVTVFKTPDVNGFRYVSPWLAYVDYPENNVVECRLRPVYKSRPYAAAKAGEMAVTFAYLKQPKSEPRPKKGAPPPAGPSPLDLQVYRELGPIFRHIMKDFRITFTFETYCPVQRSGLGFRGRRVAAHSIDLIDFSHRDLDQYGNLFLENEELMLDLVRWELGSKDIVDHVRGFVANHTVPAFLPTGSKYMWWTGGNEIPFKPSRALFDRHFKGKMLNYNEWAPRPTDRLVPAEFGKIGWQGSNRNTPDTRPSSQTTPGTHNDEDADGKEST